MRGRLSTSSSSSDEEILSEVGVALNTASKLLVSSCCNYVVSCFSIFGLPFDVLIAYSFDTFRCCAEVVTSKPVSGSRGFGGGSWNCGLQQGLP